MLDKTYIIELRKRGAEGTVEVAGNAKSSYPSGASTSDLRSSKQQTLVQADGKGRQRRV